MPNGRPRRSDEKPPASAPPRSLSRRGDHESQTPPRAGLRAYLGILRLARSYGSARIEAACRRGNDIGATTYGSIKSILQHGLDRGYANERPPDDPPIRHGNIRGTDYYH
jgi:transposase